MYQQKNVDCWFICSFKNLIIYILKWALYKIYLLQSYEMLNIISNLIDLICFDSLYSFGNYIHFCTIFFSCLLFVLFVFVVFLFGQVELKIKERERLAFINPELSLQEKEKGNAAFKEGLYKSKKRKIYFCFLCIVQISFTISTKIILYQLLIFN